MTSALKLIPLAICVLSSGMAAAQSNSNCTCRHKGLDYKLGEEVCISRASGAEMARCEMVLNNTSWNFIDQPCPKISLNNLSNHGETDTSRISIADSPNTILRVQATNME